MKTEALGVNGIHLGIGKLEQTVWMPEAPVVFAVNKKLKVIKEKIIHELIFKIITLSNLYSSMQNLKTFDF